MYTKIIDELYKKAETITLEDKDKVVFISDCHRGDGSYKDPLMSNYNTYKGALKYYLKNNFKLVEIGDGDDLWRNKDYGYIGYYYEEIFEILLKFKKEHRLYLFWGNHDIIKKYKQEFLNLLDISKEEKFYKILKDLYGDVNFYEALKFHRKGDEFFVFHGHQIDKINSNFWRISCFLLRNVWARVESIGIKTPTLPAQNIARRKVVDKRILNWSIKNNKKVIAGHTHKARLGNHESGYYYNDGCCVYPNHITTIEYIEGKLNLIKWYLDLGDDGKIILTRKIINY